MELARRSLSPNAGQASGRLFHNFDCEQYYFVAVKQCYTCNRSMTFTYHWPIPSSFSHICANVGLCKSIGITL